VLRSQEGVKDVDVSFAAERGRLRYDPKTTDLDAVLKDLDRLGYRARLLTDPGQRQVERQQQRTLLQLIVAAAFGMQVMLFYFVRLYPLYAAGTFDTPEVRRIQYLVWLLATPVLFIGGSSILRGAWRALRARTATMDTLVALGTLAAYSYSAYVTLTGSGEAYFDSVAMITTFIMLGRYLEAVGGSRARKDIRHLLQLQPETAHRQENGNWSDLPARSLQPGDVILIRPGERVPADAEVISGEGALDEALLSGEATPVEKGPGDTVYAGTVLADAALTARVSRATAASRLAQITRLVDQTLASKPPIQRLADRASAYFAVGILLAAILTGIGWWLAGQGTAPALLAAVAVLVVACPCALGLATPLALTVTLGRTTQAGILVRNATALETAARVERLVFDKTGTLTQGKMSVTAVVPTAAGNDEDLIAQAAAVEQFSEHPVGRAIVAAYGRQPPAADGFSSTRGQGARAALRQNGRQQVRVGSARFLQVPDDEPLQAQAEARATGGETIVWVGQPGHIAGFIALGDELNPTAKPALAALRQLNIQPVLLSGDNPRTTAAIAAALAMPAYEGNCPPDEKAARIKSWQEAGEHVAMTGDGVNDAPALAQADLSMTVAGGTDVAGETSDVVLTAPDLTLVPWLIRRSRRTRRIILENLGWAFAYNIIAVPLAAFGLISPVLAAAAMACSSLLVVGNSLRLRSA
jgi:heavy metal translocating P-type ATPase